MIVKIKDDRKTVIFDSLTAGETFLGDDNKLYLKTSVCNQAAWELCSPPAPSATKFPGSAKVSRVHTLEVTLV